MCLFNSVIPSHPASGLSSSPIKWIHNNKHSKTVTIYIITYIYIYIYIGSVWEYDTLYKSSQSQSIRNIKQQTKLRMLYDCGPRHKIWQLGSSAILSCSPHSNCHMLVVHRPFLGQTHIIYDRCMSPTNIPWLVQPFNRPIHMWVVIVVKPSIWAKWGSFSISK